MAALPPLHGGSASSSPLPSPVHHRVHSGGGGGGSTTTVSLSNYSPYSLAAQQHAAAYLHANQEDKEVICSNMSDRVRLMLDILQLAPPQPSEKVHARDPNLAPSPKPLFGTRPPPAALALQRGFSVGARDRAAAEQRDREAAFALAALPLNGEGSSPPNRPSSPLILAPTASYSSSFDSPFKSGGGGGGRKEGPLVSGWLSMQKNAGKWKRFWVEYASDGILSYRVDDTTKKPAGTIQVSYVEAEITPLPKSALSAKRKEFEPPLASGADAAPGVTESLARLSLERSVTTPVPNSGGVMLPAIGGATGGSGPPIIPPLMLASPVSTAPLSKLSEEYWRYLEDECAFATFKVVSPNRVFLFKADNPGSPAALQAAANSSNPAGVLCGEELRNQFVTTMRAHLQQAFSLIPGGVSQPVTPSAALPQLNFNSVADVPQRNASPPPGSGFSSSLQVPSASTSFGFGGSSSPSSSSSHNPALPSLIWKQKNECLSDLTPLFHEQFMVQVGRYKALQQALSRPPPHSIEDELPITSTRKEKSGVLCMEQVPGAEDTNNNKTKGGLTLFSATGASSSSSAAASSSSSSAAASSSSSSSSSSADDTRWRDYYFVLFEGALFYYKDSKSTTPTGFITLRFASLVVDPKRLSRQEYVFHVVTPLRTICCKTKHPVALSEWISVLENTLATYAKKNAAGPPALLPQGSDKNLLKQEREAAALAQQQQSQPFYPPISGMTQTFNKDGSLFEGPPPGLPLMLGSAPRSLSNLALTGGSNPNLLGGGGGSGGGAFTFGGANGINGSGGSNPVTPQRGGDRSGGGSGHKPGSSMDSTPPLGLTNLSPATPNGPGSDRKSSLTVLQNINKWINNELHSTFRDFQALIQHPQGLEAFRRALLRDDDAGGSGGPASTPKGSVSNTSQNSHLDFYLASVEYANLFTNPLFPPSISEVISCASQMFLRFLTPSNPAEFLAETTEEQRGIIEDQLPSPSPTTFDGVRQLTQSILQGEFHEFKRTPEFAALGETLNRSVVEDKREIEPFDATSSQLFMIKVKGTKKSREVLLLKKIRVHTIGRDKSNMLVIEDSRVSRSHARVEYTDTQCEYIDLGSSCGSKLNGKPVLRAKLRPGDVIELGQSVLIFQIRKKKSAVENFLSFVSR